MFVLTVGGGCASAPDGLRVAQPTSRSADATSLGRPDQRDEDGLNARAAPAPSAVTSTVSAPSAPPPSRPNGLSADEVDAVRKVVEAASGRFADCYDLAPPATTLTEANVAVDFTIDPSGSVPTASASGWGSIVEGCLVSEVRALRFPPRVGGATVRVNYPFVFKS